MCRWRIMMYMDENWIALTHENRKQNNKKQEQYSMDYTECRFWRNRSAMLCSTLYLATTLVSGNECYDMIPTRLQAGGSVLFWKTVLMAIYLTWR